MLLRYIQDVCTIISRILSYNLNKNKSAFSKVRKLCMYIQGTVLMLKIREMHQSFYQCFINDLVSQKCDKQPQQLHNLWQSLKHIFTFSNVILRHKVCTAKMDWRLTSELLLKKVFYGELQEGKRSQDGQKKRYKDTLKASLKDFNIPTDS